MTTVFLGLGSNINREQAIADAIASLENEFGDLLISPTFESESIGFTGDNFFNLVVAVETDKSLEAVILINKSIEDASGRNRADPKFSARTLDIDILLFGDRICESPIGLPRGEILENAYVLWPLSIIAAKRKHPVTGLTFEQQWKAYESEQNLWQVERE